MQEFIHPLTISHGMTAPLEGTSRFRHEFDWTGTRDISAWCVIPYVISEVSKIVGMSWGEIMKHNNNLVTEARKYLCQELDISPPCPDKMLTSIATIKLNFDDYTNLSIHEPDAIHIELLEEYNIQVPVWYWPNPEGRYMRISAQIYNNLDEYEYLAFALKNVCKN
jgi:isopenicillin-N epimerase